MRRPFTPPGLIRRAFTCLIVIVWQFTALPQPASAQGSSYAPGACSQVPNSKTCLDTTPCKTDTTGVPVCLAGVTPPTGGLNVPQTCWQYSYQYACDGGSSDTCTPYENNPACGIVASACQDHAQPSGTCDSWNYTYQCQTKAATTQQQTVCTNGLFDTSLLPTPKNTNNTFQTAAIAQEMMREAQVYSKDGTEIFSGVAEMCRKGYWGLQNCCKSSPGAKANSQIAQLTFGAAAQTVKYAGSEAVDWASPYVFDAMYNNGIWTQAMTDAFATGGDTYATSLAAGGASVGAYGFTYSFAGTYTEGQGLFGGDILIAGGEDGFLVFNPYVFVAIVVIAIVQSLTQCTQDEQMLAMHKGANLSVFEKEDCTSKSLGSCIQYTDTYCSFNSVLAKIINTQGKPQLGLDPTTCTGFTLAQVSSLDFSKMDFSEFTTAITAQATSTMPSQASIQQGYSSAVSGGQGGSAQAGTLVTTQTLQGGGAPGSSTVNPNLPTYQQP